MFWLGGLGEFGLGGCLVFLICLFLFDCFNFFESPYISLVVLELRRPGWP